jgi:hypothetical protein
LALARAIPTAVCAFSIMTNISIFLWCRYAAVCLACFCSYTATVKTSWTDCSSPSIVPVVIGFCPLAFSCSSTSRVTSSRCRTHCGLYVSSSSCGVVRLVHMDLKNEPCELIRIRCRSSSVASQIHQVACRIDNKQLCDGC